jgi:hypothetical protein
MSMNISGLGNTYNGINTNSKQYKALKEKGWLSGIMQNEAMMSAEERLIYETFGGRDTIIKNLMKQFDSDGDLLNANGVAGYRKRYIMAAAHECIRGISSKDV